MQKTRCKSYILDGSIFIKSSELLLIQKVDEWLLEGRMGKNRVWLKGCGIPLWVDENVLILILMMIAHICEYTKNTEFHILNR